MTDPLLIYGAYGYTGELIAKRALELGLRPILSGRDREKLTALAAQLGLECRVAALDDSAALGRALEGMVCVLHCAGPFVRTSAAMLDACLRAGAHYLDITGEIPVLEALARRDAQARDAGVLVMPGVGFDVVPSDCLALHLKQLLPTATHLRLGIMSRGGVSHGTATTALEYLDNGAMVRSAGQLESIRVGSRRRLIDFGTGPLTTVAITWGDVASAWYSTHIPNIEVYWAMPRTLAALAPWLAPLLPLVKAGPIRRLAQRRIDAVRGPNDERRARGGCVLWGEVSDANGARRHARLHTPDGYTLTAHAAVHIARKVLAGGTPLGFHTPASAFGADLVLELGGVRREMVD